MTAALGLLLLVAFGTSAQGESSGADTAPSYTEGSIVNGTTHQLGPFAPSGVASIYGKNLAYGEESASAISIGDQRWALPHKLARVQVLIVRGALGQPAPLLYVGPGQINFVIPGRLDPGPIEIQVVRDGRSGPAVKLTLQETAPELFPGEGGYALAHRVLPPDYTKYVLATPEAPARPGEIVVLYATGLGRSVLALEDGEVPTVPRYDLGGLRLTNREDVRVLLNEMPLDAGAIQYAGLTPGCAALYQINVRLPANMPSDPELRIAVGDALSMEGLRLAVDPAVAEPQP